MLKLAVPFQLESNFKPRGDQGQAIAKLLKSVEGGNRHQTLLGVTGSGILGSLVTLVYFGVIVAFLAAMVFGMVKGYQGQSFKLPIVGDMAEKWA